MINADVCVYAKTEDSVEGRRYNPSDFPQFSNLTSTTTTLRINLIQDERAFSDRYSRKGNMCFLIKSNQRTLKKKTSHAANNKLFVNIFSRALQNIWRMINWDGMGMGCNNFGAYFKSNSKIVTQMSLVSILAVPRTLVGKWAQNLHSYAVEQFLIERQKA